MGIGVGAGIFRLAVSFTLPATFGDRHQLGPHHLAAQRIEDPRLQRTAANTGAIAAGAGGRRNTAGEIIPPD